MQINIKCNNFNFTVYEFHISCIFAYLSKCVDGEGVESLPLHSPPWKTYNLI